MEIVWIKCVDQTRYTGTWDADIPFALKIAYVCGILIGESEDGITVCQTYFDVDEGQARDILVIPKSTILEMKKFEVD